MSDWEISDDDIEKLKKLEEQNNDKEIEYTGQIQAEEEEEININIINKEEQKKAAEEEKIKLKEQQQEQKKQKKEKKILGEQLNDATNDVFGAIDQRELKKKGEVFSKKQDLENIIDMFSIQEGQNFELTEQEKKQDEEVNSKVDFLMFKQNYDYMVVGEVLMEKIIKLKIDQDTKRKDFEKGKLQQNQLSQKLGLKQENEKSGEKKEDDEENEEEDVEDELGQIKLSAEESKKYQDQLSQVNSKQESLQSQIYSLSESLNQFIKNLLQELWVQNKLKAKQIDRVLNQLNDAVSQKGKKQASKKPALKTHIKSNNIKSQYIDDEDSENDQDDQEAEYDLEQEIEETRIQYRNDFKQFIFTEISQFSSLGRVIAQLMIEDKIFSIENLEKFTAKIFEAAINSNLINNEDINKLKNIIKEIKNYNPAPTQNKTIYQNEQEEICKQQSNQSQKTKDVDSDEFM